MVYNCHYEYMSLIVNLFILVFIKTRYVKKYSIVTFERLVVSTIIVTVFHVMTAYCATNAAKVPFVFNHIMTGGFLVFAVVHFNSYFEYSVSYLKGSVNFKLARILGTGMFVATFIAVIINYFHPILFYYDLTTEENLHWLTLGNSRDAFPAAYMLVALFVVIKHRDKFIKRQLFAIIAFSVSMSVGISLQKAVFTHVYVVYFFTMLALLLILFSLETPDYGKLSATMDELKEARDEAERATSAKSAFLARMSHEIRTPINAILGLDEMIIRESRDNGIKKYALDVRSSGQALLSLINDILDFSKIESGKMEIMDANYDLAELLYEVDTITSGRAKAKELDFFINVDPEIPRFLRGDENRIRQVLINLLSNGVKYTEKGRVTLNINYERITDDDNHANITFLVKDTGVGIKPEDIEKIFMPFERVAGSEARKIEGTGLGISITQQLLELMGSKLEVESEYGKGSSFFFTIKQEVKEWTYVGNYEDVSRTLDSSHSGYEESFTAPKARILVVDDVPLNLTVVKGLLKNSLMTIDTASSGKEAVFMASKNEYQVIFIDHLMPDMDGIETAHIIRESEESKNRKTPLIALTANAVSGAKEYYLTEGFAGYLSKPIIPSELERFVIRYLPIEMIEDAPKPGESADENSTIIKKLADIPELNVEAGITASGTPEIYVKVAEDFYNTIDTRTELIETACENDDIENYTIQAHALKTSARLIGYAALSNMAKDMEDKGNEGDVASIRVRTKELLFMYRGIKAPLATVFGGEDEADKPLITEEQLKDAVRTIYTCEEKFDTEMAEMVFEQLSAYKMPDDFKPIYRKLQSLLAEVARDDIIELLKNYHS